ncbi:MAG: glycosyltransferase [Spirochaetia bacterium]|jgi:hypothetical protein
MFRKILKSIFRKIHPVDVSSLYTEVPRSTGKIPNRVYQTWISPVLPFLHARGLKRFRKLNPDFSFSFFDDQRMASYMESNYAGHPILKVFKDVRMPAEKADIWRYCLLFREGGIYCDIKSALAIPLRELIHDDYSELLSFERNSWKNFLDPGRFADPDLYLPSPPDSIRSNLDHPDNVIINWFLCFEKGSPILEELINLIVRHSQFFRGKTFDRVDVAGNHFTGPLAFTQAVWRWMQKTGKRPTQCGIDFSGQGIWKLFGMDYSKSPHHSSMRNLPLLD